MPTRRSLMLRDGLISCGALLLAFAAFDDITTDHSTVFPVEYTLLAACAAWFGITAVRLMRGAHPILGLVSMAALLAALWAQQGIGPGAVPGFWTEYVVLAAALVWFLALALTLIVLGVRGGPTPATPRP